MLIYIACPYNGTQKEIKFRMKCVSKLIGELQKDGHFVITPLLYHYIMDQCVSSKGKYWVDFSRLMLNFKGIDKMIVVKCDGWDKSYGVKIEIEECQKLGIPIEYKETKQL